MQFMVVVDKLTKMVHYIPTTTNADALQLARQFIDNVVRLHGVPESIVSDRDSKFTSLFWKSLWEQLGTKLHLSTAYHPQSDGQTERANRVLEEALSVICESDCMMIGMSIYQYWNLLTIVQCQLVQVNLHLS